MSRSDGAAGRSARRAARATMAWCTVGTAAYHVGPNSTSQSKNAVAMNPGVVTTLPPAATEASSVDTRP